MFVQLLLDIGAAASEGEFVLEWIVIELRPDVEVI